MSQCTAKSSRSGKRCKAPAIRGGSVCQAHGGSAPQVRRAAALRLLAGVDAALDALLQDIHQKKDRRLRQAAYTDLLDRAGFKSAEKFIIEEPHRLTGFDADLSQLTNEELAVARKLAQKAARRPEPLAAPGNGGAR
jgi:hypothetical protein